LDSRFRGNDNLSSYDFTLPAGAGDILILIAPSGQTRGQAPQAIQSMVIKALPPSILIASVGQISLHVPHPEHFSVVTKNCIQQMFYACNNKL
jgi:hypothetical protein